MDNCLENIEIHTENEEEYKIHVDNAIVNILLKDERLVFATVVEKAKITPYIINKYPELRSYILQKMKYHKEMFLIDKKINKVVSNLIKNNKTVTVLSIINKCKFGLDNIYGDEIIKDKIRSAVIQAKQGVI